MKCIACGEELALGQNHSCQPTITFNGPQFGVSRAEFDAQAKRLERAEVIIESLAAYVEALMDAHPKVRTEVCHTIVRDNLKRRVLEGEKE